MAKPYKVLAEMTSNSTGEKYEIREGGDGTTYCTCLSWRFSKLRPRTCKHLALYSEDVMLSPAQPVTPTLSAVAAALAHVGLVTIAPAPTALDHAIGLTRKMVAAARLTLAPAVVQMMAAELAKHVPAPGPVLATATTQLTPGKVRMISFD